MKSARKGSCRLRAGQSRLAELLSGRAKSARHFLQFHERRVRHPRTGLDGVFDDAVEAAVDEEDGAFARLAVNAVWLPRAEPETGEIAQPPADDALDRLGHDSVAHA